MEVPPQLPPKKDVATALLQGPSLFIHLDPRKPEVVVPKWFKNQPQLVLQVGMNMAVPIPDLEVSDDGICCTLSFNRSPFWCSLPFAAIYALVGEDGRGMIWPDDVPPELASEKKRPALKVVGSKRSPKKGPSKAPIADAGVADAGVADAGEKADDATTPGADRRGASPRPVLAAVADPQDDAPEVADDPEAGDAGESAEVARKDIAAVEPNAGSGAEAAAPEGVSSAGATQGSSQGAADDSEGDPAEEPAADSGGKRELPPYLRVIK